MHAELNSYQTQSVLQRTIDFHNVPAPLDYAIQAYTTQLDGTVTACLLYLESRHITRVSAQWKHFVAIHQMETEAGEW
jgi:hypothetical protein